jgi:probable phosphoglycerate mutase
MEIVILRHAQPEWTKDGYSVDNPPLTEVGFAQADLLAKVLRDEHFDEIFVSPLVRTQQTAAPLLAVKSHQLVIADWLEEIRNPIWHGTPEEKANEAWRAEKAKTSHDRWSGLDGGEAVNDFVDRINIGVSLFLEEQGITRADNQLPVWETNSSFNENKRIALVAHAGTGSVAICHMLGLQPTPWEWERFVIGHASINRLCTFPLGDGITFGLAQLSNNEHLPLEMRTY